MSSFAWIGYCDLFFATVMVVFSFLLKVMNLQYALQWLQINLAGFFMKKEQVVGNREDSRA